MAFQTFFCLLIIILFTETNEQICPDGTYHKHGDCPLCSECELGEKVEVKKCTKNADTVCKNCTKCQLGEFVSETCVPNKDTVCKNCTKCQPGTFVSERCDSDKDTVCESCPADTFSNKTNTDKCELCSYCIGQEIEQHCNSTSDTICKDKEKKESKASTTCVKLTVIFCLVLVIFVVAGVLIWQRKRLPCRKRPNGGTPSNENDSKELKPLKSDTSSPL